MARGRSRARVALAAAAVGAASLLAACEFIYSVPLEQGTDGGVEASSDVHPADAGRDIGHPREAGRDAGHDGHRPMPDGGSDAGTTYNPITSSTDWSSFNTQTLNPSASGFAGATFDGRYVYLSPLSNTRAVRYDTHASFTAAASWSSFETEPLLVSEPVDAGDAGVPPPPTSNAYNGCVFDGQYVYYVPGSSPPAFAVRYDTTKAFTAGSAWQAFETSTLPGGQVYGFLGGTFDGRYVYLAPNESTVATRYDTKGAFNAAASWSTFQLGGLEGDAGIYTYYYGGGSFGGAIFDGKRVYLIPQYGTVVVAYDTSKPFSTSSSWTAFDFSVVHKSATDFATGVFDGRYLYLIPGGGSFDYSEVAIVIRYDTTQAFSSVAAWSFFNLAGVLMKPAPQFWGGTFDGRYIYLAPNLGPAGVNPSALVYQYDTSQSFFAQTSWTTYSTQPFDNAMGFNGAVFDGEYVYFVPSNNGATDGVVARFNAKTPPSMPALPEFHGSFF